MSENDKVTEILERAARGDGIGNKLMYDKSLKSLRPSSTCSDPDRVIPLTNQDSHLWHFTGRMPR
jgi:hypothetical protein